jgi:predicted ribosomally synthesized peptide with SipW-like signal peptide
MRTNQGRLAATLLALVAIGGVGSFGTYAAFTDTTANTGSTFTAGDVEITDDDGGQAMFTLADPKLGPGDAIVTRCINVTNNGTLPHDAVAFYGAVGGTGLQAELMVDIDRGTGATGGTGFSCTGFTKSDDLYAGALTGFNTSASPISDTSGWAVGATKSYRISGSLPASASQSLEGKDATLTLTWDATS